MERVVPFRAYDPVAYDFLPPYPHQVTHKIVFNRRRDPKDREAALELDKRTTAGPYFVPKRSKRMPGPVSVRSKRWPNGTLHFLLNRLDWPSYLKPGPNCSQVITSQLEFRTWLSSRRQFICVHTNHSWYNSHVWCYQEQNDSFFYITCPPTYSWFCYNQHFASIFFCNLIDLQMLIYVLPIVMNGAKARKN